MWPYIKKPSALFFFILLYECGAGKLELFVCMYGNLYLNNKDKLKA